MAQLITYDYIKLTIPTRKFVSALVAIVIHILPQAHIGIVLVVVLIFMF